MAKQRFQFSLHGWGVRTHTDRLEMVMGILKQATEQEFLAQLNSVYSDSSSPEYKKHLKNIPDVAETYAQARKLSALYRAQQEGHIEIVFSKSADELFDQLGRAWLRVDQFDGALEAFKTCVEISRPREGPWWAQRHCARYNHLGYAHMIMGNKQEQLQASLKGASYAVAILNSAVDCVTFSDIFQLSFCNVAIQISNCNPVVDTVMQFRKNTLQSWEYHVAERRRTLEEKLASGIKVEFTKEDLCFALADFLIHNNRDAIRTMLDILNYSSSFESISASEPDFGPATREFQTLIKVCRMDSLDVTLDAEDQAIQSRPNSHSSFAVDLLELAILELPSEYKGWSLSVSSISLYSDEMELPYYPGLIFWLSIKDESASSSVSSGGLAIMRSKGTATLVPAEGSKHEELEAIIKRLRSKQWNLKEQSDSLEFAAVGRDLAHWAGTSSTSAVTPFENVEIALYSLNRMVEMLRMHFQHRIAKPMLQNFVPWFVDQPNPKLKEICMAILLEYIQMCDLLEDDEEKVNCCTKALKLADEERLIGPKVKLHLLLGITYTNEKKIPEAEKELYYARNALTQKPVLVEDDNVLAAIIEGAEGYLELCKSNPPGQINTNRGTNDHLKSATSKLETSVKLLEKQFTSSHCEFYVKFNWIATSLRLSYALLSGGDFPRAHFICSKALKAAKELKLSFRAASAAWTCGNLAALMGNFLSAENYYREGLQELDIHGSVEEYLAGRLHGALGETLMEQSRLPQAEVELRQAVDACSRVLMERNLTSKFRISTFESLKMFYNNLQSCLFQIYQQTTDQSEKGIKAMEALIAAEQGRCRDLTFNLEKLLKSRDTDNDSLCNDRSVDKMDWKRFDLDKEYAWGHLKHCMTVSADAIKKQNPEVQRVTFVEYTLTRRHMLIWVLHSYGTQEPSSDQASTALPSMFSVDILSNYENSLATDELPGFLEDFSWMFGPRTSESHYDFILQSQQAFEAIIVFEKQIEDLRNGPEPDNKKINALYKLLIKPIADQLVNGEPVIFIPHEGLSFVPFAALKPAGKKAKHLIQNHPIGTASSLRTLGWATNQYIASRSSSTTTSTTNPILLVADPKPLGVAKVLLDDSIKEVIDIATTTMTSNRLNDEASSVVITLTREQATLKNVTAVMKSASWCHFACHGEVNSEYPQGVLFMSRTSTGHEGDVEAADLTSYVTSSNQHAHNLGFLTPEIIADNVRSMKAHAVVLSACKVGLGTKTGEGLLGLSRAFLQAGVPVVLAPLRTVDSALCCAFMHRLYVRMVDGESMMFALRNTMVDVLEGRVPVTRNSDGTLQRWQLWDWAAWLAVGFPGVCLPLCAGPDQ